MPDLSHADFDQLSAYLDNELSDAERADLERRLETDQALVAALDELRVVQAATRALPTLTAPRDFRLDPALYTVGTFQLTAAPRPDETQQPIAPASRPVRRRYQWASVVSALAAVMVMACGLLIVLGSSFDSGMMSAPMMLNSIESQRGAEVAFDATAYQNALATEVLPPDIAATGTVLAAQLEVVITTDALFFEATITPDENISARSMDGAGFAGESPAPLPNSGTVGNFAADTSTSAESEVAEESVVDEEHDADDMALEGTEGITKMGAATFEAEGAVVDEALADTVTDSLGAVEEEAAEAPAGMLPLVAEQQENMIAEGGEIQPGAGGGGEPSQPAAAPFESPGQPSATEAILATQLEAPADEPSPTTGQLAVAPTPTVLATVLPSPTAAPTATPPPMPTSAPAPAVEVRATTGNGWGASGFDLAGVGLLLLGSGGILLALAGWFFRRSRRAE